MKEQVFEDSLSNPVSSFRGLYFDEVIRNPAHMRDYREKVGQWLVDRITDFYVREWFFCLDHPRYRNHTIFLLNPPQGPLRLLKHNDTDSMLKLW